jgi:hypothetical protein
MNEPPSLNSQQKHVDLPKDNDYIPKSKTNINVEPQPHNNHLLKMLINNNQSCRVVTRQVTRVNLHQDASKEAFRLHKLNGL